jgi:predicted RNA-binding Zn-ribbon protein involved in translation (DUF1610 family)
MCGTSWEVSNVSDIYVGIREETEDRKDESLLRQHVCPQCGNVDILTGDEEFDKDAKPILAGDKFDECCSYYRCAGGFGKFIYRFLPHKCTACGARFTAVKREKAHLNTEIIAWYALFAITVAAHIALSMLQIANDVPAWLAPIAIAVPLSILYVNVMIKIHDNTYDKDPGPDYICENGPSDSAFRRLEAKYEEEIEEETEDEEDLDAETSSDEKKTVQDVFESLTPEQKAVVEYLIGDRMQIYANGQPIIQIPQPTIRTWDIQF